MEAQKIIDLFEKLDDNELKKLCMEDFYLEKYKYERYFGTWYWGEILTYPEVFDYMKNKIIDNKSLLAIALDANLVKLRKRSIDRRRLTKYDDVMFETRIENYKLFNRFKRENPACKEVMQKLLDLNPKYIGLMNRKDVTKEMVIKALRANPCNVLYIPNSYQTEDMWRKAIATNPRIIRLDTRYLDEELCDYAFSQDYRLLGAIPERYQTEEMYQSAYNISKEKTQDPRVKKNITFIADVSKIGNMPFDYITKDTIIYYLNSNEAEKNDEYGIYTCDPVTKIPWAALTKEMCEELEKENYKFSKNEKKYMKRCIELNNIRLEIAEAKKNNKEFKEINLKNLPYLYHENGEETRLSRHFKGIRANVTIDELIEGYSQDTEEIIKEDNSLYKNFISMVTLAECEYNNINPRLSEDPEISLHYVFSRLGISKESADDLKGRYYDSKEFFDSIRNNKLKISLWTKKETEENILARAKIITNYHDKRAAIKEKEDTIESLKKKLDMYQKEIEDTNKKIAEVEEELKMENLSNEKGSR